MITAALNVADPAHVVKNGLADVEITADRIFLVSVGKAAVAMATAAVEQFGEQLVSGVVTSKLAADHPTISAIPDHFTYFQAGHPIPDERSIRATKTIREMLAETTAADHVLCCISGGASALLTAPVLPLAQWQALNRALVHCGCTINEINVVRQCFDVAKGGGLAEWAHPTACTAFILSDVIGNDLATIGSGPTVPTERDVNAVRAVLEQYDVWGRLSAETISAIKAHLETSQDTETALNVVNRIVGNVEKSAAAAAEVARSHGYVADVVSCALVGEAREVGRTMAERAMQLPSGHCEIYGGETTVTLSSETIGEGGRNQEMALAAALTLDGHPTATIGTLATDGEDGDNDGAGAIVDGGTVGRAKQLGLDPDHALATHDSHTFFTQLEHGHLRLGSTGTNVNDLLFLVNALP